MTGQSREQPGVVDPVLARWYSPFPPKQSEIQSRGSKLSCPKSSSLFCMACLLTHRALTNKQMVQNQPDQSLPQLPARSQGLNRPGWKSLPWRASSYGTSMPETPSEGSCPALSHAVPALGSTCESQQRSVTAMILTKQYNGSKNWKSRNRNCIYSKQPGRL